MTLKVGIHSFYACHSASKRVSVEIDRQVCFVVSLGKALYWIASAFEWLDW